MFTSRVRFFIGLLAIALYCSVAVVEAAPTKGSAPANNGRTSNGRGASTPATGSKLTSGSGKCKAKFKRTRGAGGGKIVAAKGPRGPKGKASGIKKSTAGHESSLPKKSTPPVSGSGGRKKRSELFDLVARAPTTLYHITSETSANDIMANGVALNCVGDFSPQNMPGFYVASDKAKLIKWCKTGINRKCTHLVEFHYNKGAITDFKFNAQNQEAETWADSDDFCKYLDFTTWCVHDSKEGQAFPTSLTGSYAALQTVDVVVGPMLDVYDFDQYAFRSAAALTALGAPVQVHKV